ncbi:MAG: YncE family protein [Polyangia bacterium]
MRQTTGTWLGLALGVVWLGCGGGGGGSAPPKKGVVGSPAAGGSGAFGVVTIAGHQKMYLPQPGALTAGGNATIAVVDVGLAGQGVQGAPALLKVIDLGTSDAATATGGDGTVIIAVSTDNPTITFIDPNTDTVTKSIKLDATYGVSDFSGGGGYVTGVAVDSPNQRAYLSVWNGFAIVDLSSKTISSTIQVPPSENFGFDSVNQRILAPFYDCSSASDPNTAAPPPFCSNFKDQAGNLMTDGLNVIDLLDDNTVYTYQDPQALDTRAPLGDEPDSAAADPATGQIVVPSEGNAIEYVVDLSQATFDKAHKSVTAPHIAIDASNADELTGVAIEPSSHIAFFESELGPDMGAADLSAETAAQPSYLHAAVPPLPDGTEWTNLFDPHGIAVTIGLIGGHPVGFLVNSSYHWVARVDLTAFLALPPTAGLTAGQLEVADASSAVTFLDVTTPVP